MLTFPKRARRDQTVTSRRRIWLSRCGRYRIVFARCLFGPRRGSQAIHDVWRAEVRDQWGWALLSGHRKWEPAFRACQSNAREELSPRRQGAKKGRSR